MTAMIYQIIVCWLGKKTSLGNKGKLWLVSGDDFTNSVPLWFTMEYNAR